LLLTSRLHLFFTLAWGAMWAIASLVVALGMGMLIRSFRIGQITSVRLQQLLLVLAVTATCSLIQYPLSFPNYFCYVAPLVLLSVAAVLSFVDRPPRLPITATFFFYCLYAVFEMTPAFIYNIGNNFSPDVQTVELELERAGGLRVDVRSAREYDQLNGLIRQNAHGEYILAAPNCPEVYFLYGFQPPTHDFFSFSDDSRQNAAGILGNLEKDHVNLVVLNHRDSMFVPSVSNGLTTKLEQEFPNSAQAGDFEVRWKH